MIECRRWQIANDDVAQFCNKCGAPMKPVPLGGDEADNRTPQEPAAAATARKAAWLAPLLLVLVFLGAVCGLLGVVYLGNSQPPPVPVRAAPPPAAAPPASPAPAPPPPALPAPELPVTPAAPTPTPSPAPDGSGVQP